MFSGNVWSCLPDVKPLAMYNAKGRIALEPVQWNLASSRVDLSYREDFWVAAVTSVSLGTLDNVLGDSL